MVGGLAGGRRLHKDRARDAAGTRPSGSAAAPDAGAGEGLRGAGRAARRGHARGAPQESIQESAGDQSTMSASEQAIEPSSSSPRPPPLPPPLPPPPPRPPVAAEGRGAQAARAAAVWAGIREARLSRGLGGDGPLHLHAISMRPARARPAAPPPARSSACTFLAATFQGLTPPLPGPAAGAATRSRAAAGEGSRGTRRQRRGRGMHRSPPPAGPKYLPAAKLLGFLEFRDGKAS